MFIMQGEEVKLVRHVISYAEDENEMQDMCISDEYKREMEQILASKGIKFTTKSVDQTRNEWFDGLCFKAYDKAREVFEAGEQAYLADKRRQEAIDNLQLRADIDFLSTMAGVEL